VDKKMKPNIQSQRIKLKNYLSAKRLTFDFQKKTKMYFLTMNFE